MRVVIYMAHIPALEVRCTTACITVWIQTIQSPLWWKWLTNVTQQIFSPFTDFPTVSYLKFSYFQNNRNATGATTMLRIALKSDVRLRISDVNETPTSPHWQLTTGIGRRQRDWIQLSEAQLRFEALVSARWLICNERLGCWAVLGSTAVWMWKCLQTDCGFRRSGAQGRTRASHAEVVEKRPRGKVHEEYCGDRNEDQSLRSPKDVFDGCSEWLKGLQ